MSISKSNSEDWWDDSLSKEGKNTEETEFQKNVTKIKSMIEIDWSDDIVLKIKSSRIAYPKLYTHRGKDIQAINDKKGLDELVNQHYLFSKKVKFKFKRVREQAFSSAFCARGWELRFEGVIPEFEYLGGEKVDSIFWGPKYTPISWKFTSRVIELKVQINPPDKHIELYLDDYTNFNCYYEIVEIDKQLAQRFFELAKEMYPNYRPNMHSFYAHPSHSTTEFLHLSGKTVLISNGE